MCVRYLKCQLDYLCVHVKFWREHILMCFLKIKSVSVCTVHCRFGMRQQFIALNRTP